MNKRDLKHRARRIVAELIYDAIDNTEFVIGEDDLSDEDMERLREIIREMADKIDKNWQAPIVYGKS